MQTYNGNEPYIFISYAHKDSATVLPLIEALQGRGFRVWFDAGIAAGTEWPEYIADRLCDSAVVLVFLSEAALASHNCRREINFAIAEKKEMLVVYLEEVALSRGMRMQLGVLQALYRTRFTSDAAFLAKLDEAEVLRPCLDGSAPTEAAVGTVRSERLAEALMLLDEEKYDEALPLLEELADEGNAAAAGNLGLLFFQGCGVPQDDETAVYWYSKGAEGGDADAQYHLGRMYDEGYGVRQDYYDAARWYHKAAESGHTDAALSLGSLYQYGWGVPLDYEAAVRWYRKAADGGDAVAQGLLGKMYQNGRGVPQDIMQAVYWYRKAAEQGNEAAQTALKELGY